VKILAKIIQVALILLAIATYQMNKAGKFSTVQTSASNSQTVTVTPEPSVLSAKVQKPQAGASHLEVPQGSGFDFYVLSLSWSPSFCLAKGADSDPAQCRASKPFDFIVHGLWPQNERGYPEGCNSQDYPNREQIRSISDITPSAGLVRHEWEKHGGCSGLSVDDYFEVMHQARARVNIPAQFVHPGLDFSLTPSVIETAFIRANPGLNSGEISTACSHGDLSEVRICLTKGLAFHPCPEVDRDACRSNLVTIPAP
jgi:ribonuclease T2